jgi:hypothetical protein
MGTEQTGKYCPMCQAHVTATATTPNRVLHLLLTIFTFGPWLLMWPLVIAGKMGGCRCM